MKKLIIALSFIASAQCSFAQITLSASDYTSTVAGTTDTLKVVTLTTVPVQTRGADQVWDFSGVTYDTTLYRQHMSVPTGAFTATAQYADSVLDSVGFYYYYNTNNMNGIASNGLLEYGQHINRQVLPMGALTLNPADTLTLVSQDVAYPQPVENISFPATYLSAWTQHVNALVSGTLTIPAMSFDNTAFQFHYTYSVNDTVTGWGTLKLKNSSGIVTDINVLQVKSLTQRGDSTFIGGNDISEPQHDYMELPNIASSGLYYTEYKYYAVNEVTPIVDVIYTTSLASPQQVLLLSKNYPTTGIAEIANSNDITVYPNPVTDHTFYISAKKADRIDSYELINAAGQVVQRNKLLTGQSIYKVQLSRSIIPGRYSICISSNGKNICTQQIVVE